MRYTINGEPVQAEIDVRMSLLDLLRDHLQLSGTKKGCDQGACTVLVDGHRINSLTRKIYDDLLLGISKAEDRQGVVAEQ